MEIPYELIEKVDITNLIVMGVMLYFMYCRIESKAEKRFDKIDERFKKVDERFDKIDKRFDKIEEKVTDIDKRLFAVETMLHMKDCCMLKEERHHKKAV